MLVNDHEQYVRVPFENEREIEHVVQRYSEQLFGSSILYLPQAKIATLGGKGTVPDAIVIDLEAEEWYLVEAERAIHGTWEHIAPQVSKQLAALAFPDSRRTILQLALSLIQQDKSRVQLFTELGIEELEIHGHLHQILEKPVTIAIPIDGIPKDLEDWIQTLRNRAKIWVIEKFVSLTDNRRVLYSLPEENLPTITTNTGKSSGRPAVTTRTSQPYQDLLNSGLLTEGQELVMEYGPRGKPRQMFTAIVRKEGLEVDGAVKSPSYAAVYCMNKAGGQRRTANGWIRWRTLSGEFLDDLYQKLSDAAREQQQAVDAS